MKDFWRIDMRLLPVKTHFFLFMAALACVLPFRTVFAKQLGISATAVGVIFLAVPFMKIITNPFFGFIMDYFKRFRLIIGIILSIVVISHLAMLLIPPLINEDNRNLNAEKILHFRVNYNCFHDAWSEKQNEFDLQMYGEPLSNRSFDQRFMCKLQCENNNSTKTNHSEGQEVSQSCAEHISLELSILIKILAYSNKFNISLLNDKIFLSADNIHNVTDVISGHASSLLSGKSTPTSMDVEDFMKYNSSKNMFDDSGNWNQESRQNVFHTFKTRTSTSYSLIDCPCQTQFVCMTADCRFVRDDDPPTEVIKAKDNEFLSVQFWGLFALMGISSVTFSSILFLMDAVCYEILGDRKEKYGEQRLWGTIGWGIGALAGGYLNDILSTLSTDIDYSPGFYLLAALTFLDLIPIYKLKVENVHYSSDIFKDVGLLLSKLDMIFNILMVYAIGVLSGLIWNYQFWFMEEIGASQVLLGLSQTFECLFAELPFFVVSGWIIKKVGHINCNNITLICFGLRYLCFAYMYNPWMTLPVAFIAGPTFGLFYASMTMYGKTEAPPGTEATVQSLLSMSFEGIGAGTGSILGGVGFDKFGSRMTFLYAALVSFALLLINISWQLIDFKKRKTISIQQKPAS